MPLLFDDLPDEVHLLIYDWLTITELVKIERTSSRTQRNSKNVNKRETRLAINPHFTIYHQPTWPFMPTPPWRSARPVHEESFFDFECGFPEHAFPKESVLRGCHRIDVLMKLLPRFPKLKSLHVDKITFCGGNRRVQKAVKDLLCVIHESCPELEHLDLPDENITKIPDLAFPEITCLHFDGGKLNSVDIRRFPSLRYIENIIIKPADVLNLIKNGLCGFVAHFSQPRMAKPKELQQFIDQVVDYGQDMQVLDFGRSLETGLSDIVQRLPNLIRLGGRGYPEALDSVSNLKHLRHLDWTCRHSMQLNLFYEAFHMKIGVRLRTLTIDLTDCPERYRYLRVVANLCISLRELHLRLSRSSLVHNTKVIPYNSYELGLIYRGQFVFLNRLSISKFEATEEEFRRMISRFDRMGKRRDVMSLELREEDIKITGKSDHYSVEVFRALKKEFSDINYSTRD